MSEKKTRLISSPGNHSTSEPRLYYFEVGPYSSIWSSSIVISLLCLALIFSFLEHVPQIALLLFSYLYFSSFLVRRFLGWWRRFQPPIVGCFRTSNRSWKKCVQHHLTFLSEWGTAFRHAIRILFEICATGQHLGQIVVYFTIFPVFPHLQFGEQFICPSSILFMAAILGRLHALSLLRSPAESCCARIYLTRFTFKL